jgi:hypothetical protein
MRIHYFIQLLKYLPQKDTDQRTLGISHYQYSVCTYILLKQDGLFWKNGSCLLIVWIIRKLLFPLLLSFKTHVIDNQFSQILSNIEQEGRTDPAQKEGWQQWGVR